MRKSLSLSQLCVFTGKQLQNTNESNHAWPWNCTWLMLTLETQLNSSVLNQNGAVWLVDWDPRSPRPRLTASCCSALNLWQWTKVLVLFGCAFINPPPPHHLLARTWWHDSVWKMSVLGLGEPIWGKKRYVAVVKDIFSIQAEFLLLQLIDSNNTATFQDRRYTQYNLWSSRKLVILNNAFTRGS